MKHLLLFCWVHIDCLLGIYLVSTDIIVSMSPILIPVLKHPSLLGDCRPEDGKTIKPFSLLQLCRVGVIIYDWLDIAWLKSYYNFGFDHFNMTWRKMLDLLLQMIGLL